ncbi:DUF5327 family protein [Salinicoccus sp. ID82-1]|uniref:DUF5327 family protein n=1 Tax=Salinicoccus sp. ID82-1 TaxID=2820269 RepID=UPI001F3EFEB1|nr:DUF5327 family protein [Salinicoccus sp. ID82-1]MCG1009597.1 DUF5327 family protein [Salinicoccus sp. ID82-1]
MKREIIAELKQELHRMEVASQPHEFEKHLYAMERLLGLLKTSAGDIPAASAPTAGASAGQSLSEQDRMMLEQMGGRPVQNRGAQEPLTKETLRTDDGFGNGESLFDF